MCIWVLACDKKSNKNKKILDLLKNSYNFVPVFFQEMRFAHIYDALRTCLTVDIDRRNMVDAGFLII